MTMKQITPQQLDGILTDAAKAGHDKQEVVDALRAKGYNLPSPGQAPSAPITAAGAAPAPDAAPTGTPADRQEQYPPFKEPSLGSMAWQAGKTPIPGLAQAANFIGSTLPGAIQPFATLASKVPGAGGLAQGLEAVAGGGKSAGEMIPSTVNQGLGQAGISLAGMAGEAAWPYISPIVSKLAAPLKAFGRSALARLIGVAEPFIKTTTPQALKNIAVDDGALLEHVEKAGKFLADAKGIEAGKVTAVEDHYMDLLGKSPKAMGKVPLKDTLSNFKDEVYAAGGEVPKVVSQKVVKPSTIINEAGKPYTLTSVEKQVKNVARSQTPSITGADAQALRDTMADVQAYEKGGNAIDLIDLRRRLAARVQYNPQAAAPPLGTQADRLIKGLRREVNDKLYQVAPELREADQAASSALTAYDNLQKKFFGHKDTGLQRLRVNIMRGQSGNLLVDEAAKISAAASARMESLVSRISAQQFSPYIRKGIAGGAMAGGLPALGAGSFVNPALAAGAVGDVAALVGTSPRLWAKVLAAQPEAARAISALAKTNPIVARAAFQRFVSGPSGAAIPDPPAPSQSERALDEAAARHAVSNGLVSEAEARQRLQGKYGK